MINEALRLIRVFHNLKQTEAAEKLGISQSYISEIERGVKAPTLESLQKYAEFFGLPISAIMYLAENTGGKNEYRSARYAAKKIVTLLRFIEGQSGRSNAS